MDPSIMKLLEEDEDETMHSGADVEAFTAALNRDIEAAAASSSQPMHSDSNALSQENNQNSGQMYSQWQPSNQDENKSNQSQQQDLMNQEQREKQSSDKEVKEHVSSAEVQRDAHGGSQAPPSGLPMQYTPMQVDSKRNQAEQSSGEFSQSSAPMQMQMSGTGHPQIREPERLLNPSRESQFSNMQRFSGNQPMPAQEQAGNPANRAKQIPFGSLLPIILPELDKDRAMQLQTLYNKLRKNEIPKDGFVRLMRSIVGDQMLRLAVVKMQAKGNKAPETAPNQFQGHPQNPMQHHLRPPTGTAAQFSDPYSFGQLHQKSQNTPAIAATSRTPGSVMQPQKDSGHNSTADSHGTTQPNQMSDRSAISMQGLTKQQLQHLHFSQGSFPMYGGSGYNSPYPTSNVGTSSAIARPPQPHQLQLHQAFGSTNADVMNVPKVERQNSLSDPRVLGTNMSSASSMPPHNSVAWQPGVGKEQNMGALQSMGYVKQEPIDHSHEKQPRPSMFPSQGANFSGAVQGEAGKATAGTSNDEVSDRQHPAAAFPSSTRASTAASPSSHLNPSLDADSQRVDSEKSRHNTVVTSDVREQILAINRKAREEWEKKQAEAEKIRKNNDPDSSTGVDGEKDKEDGRGKAVKANKEEDDKMRTTAANVAARAAVGGDDMLSKWQLMAQARQKRDVGPEASSTSQTSSNAKPSATSASNAKDNRATGKKDLPIGNPASGASRQSGRNRATTPPPRAARNISIKDVIAVLEREPQMAKSTVIYRLYEKMRSETTVTD